MASPSNSGVEPKVPPALLTNRREGWHAFTRFVVINCVTVAVVLLLMLIFLRIL